MRTRIILIICVLLIFVMAGCSKQNNEDSQIKGNVVGIDVYHIHEVPECFSCKTTREYVEQTLNENFLQELNSGKITYRDIDKRLPENSDIINHFDILQGYSGVYLEIRYDNNYTEFKEYTNVVDLENETLFKKSFNEHLKELIGE